MMCTQSVAGALPCGIQITSDEKESTFKQGFLTLKSTLSENAFHDRVPDVGPEVILTDICKEEEKGTEYCFAIIYYIIVHFPHITATVEVAS